MDILKHLENSLKIVKAEPLLVIVGGFIVTTLNIISLGLLAGPILGGYILLMIKILREDKKPNFNDLFSGFKRFGELFPFCVVIILTFIIPVLLMFTWWKHISFVMIVLGLIMTIIPVVLMFTWWIYVIMLMADKHMPLGKAMKLSKKIVDKNGFFMHLVFIFMITIVFPLLLNFAATIVPPIIILQILLMPFQCGCLVSLYLENFEDTGTFNTEGPDSKPPMAPPSSNSINGVEKGFDEIKSGGTTPPPPPDQKAD